jgi:hypothetical protein
VPIYSHFGSVSALGADIFILAELPNVLIIEDKATTVFIFPSSKMSG